MRAARGLLVLLASRAPSMRPFDLVAAVASATAAAAVLAAGVPGCSDAPEGVLCEGGQCQQSAVGTWTFVRSTNPNLDLLVLVDSRAEAVALRRVLAEKLPGALTALGLPGGLPSLHLAVVPIGVGAEPSCAPAPGAAASLCALAPDYGYLATGPCGAYFVDGRRPEDVAACLTGTPGGGACDDGDPLHVLARTLEDPTAAGISGPAQFLRPDARLVIMVVTAGEIAGQPGAPGPQGQPADISAAILGRLYPQLPALFVLGPSASSCAAVLDPATVGARLDGLAEAWGGAGAAVLGLCPGTLQRIFSGLGGGALLRTIGSACLARPRDTDPAREGLQADCTVSELALHGEGGTPSRWHPVPACAVAAPPCWRLIDVPLCLDGRVELEVLRPPGFCPQISSVQRVTCSLCTAAQIAAGDPACAQP
jgi:hypothetical protein